MTSLLTPTNPGETSTTIALAALLHPTITRRDLARSIGVSPATITHHTRWLLEQGLIHSRSVRMPHAQRPVERLEVNPDRGGALTVSLSPRGVIAEVLALDGRVVKHIQEATPRPTQQTVLHAFRSVVQRVMDGGEIHRPALDFIGVSVVGYVNADPPIVYSLDGVEPWMPINLEDVLPAGAPACKVWTDVASKVRCLAADIGQMDAICYLELSGNRLHYATMRQGQLDCGWHGTSSGLHTSVSDDPTMCVCGRRGCFVQLLEQGPIKPALLREAMQIIRRKFDITYFGLELDDPAAWSEEANLEASRMKLKHCIDGERMRCRGLRLLTAEETLKHVIHRCAASYSGEALVRPVG
ncbi:MAG TPA: winged helix-turn-helix transcriptional regulator [Phycisphaeraceae bacterium]